ncbi:MAG: hypothetical protein K2G17_02595 [Duncaniella sp.]|nr:hypothetical protein [Duncaniella sp.]MDE6187004.1 hypothetical protein [Duncaniella sp.]
MILGAMRRFSSFDAKLRKNQQIFREILKNPPHRAYSQQYGSPVHKLGSKLRPMVKSVFYVVKLKIK